MDWVKAHYTQQSQLFGKATIGDQHRKIANNLHQWFQARHTPKDKEIRVLELGAGACGVAAALTEYGYDVTGVEFNPTDIELAHQLVKTYRIKNLNIIEADFYDVQLQEQFDFIYYWDGFGVGDDDAQRRLLTRIGSEWLRDDGIAFIDVFSPWNWQRRAGELSKFKTNDGTIWTREIQFDALRSRFYDLLRPEDNSQPGLSQTIRVYSLQEFLLLTEGTGVQVKEFFLDFETPIESRELDTSLSDRLMKSNGFFVQLEKRV